MGREEEGDIEPDLCEREREGGREGGREKREEGGQRKQMCSGCPRQQKIIHVTMQQTNHLHR